VRCLARAIPRLTHTIRFRLTLWYIAVLAVILIGFSGVLYFRVSQHLYAELDHSLTTEAQEVVAGLDEASGQPSLGEIPDFRLTGIAVVLFDQSGSHVVASDAPGSWPPQTESLASAAAGGSSVATVDVPGAGKWRVLTMPSVHGGATVGVLQIAHSEGDVQETLQQIITFVAVGIPITLLLAVAGGVFLAGRALDPIDRITRTAEKLGAEDLSRRLNFRGTDDEVGRLTATFDRMLDRLDRAFERQRRFTADASHDLRTPLALLISQGEVALDRPRSATVYRSTIAAMCEDARQMTRLLGDMLVLARADAGLESIDREKVNLGDLVKGVVSALQPLAQARSVELTGGVADDLVVEGDQTRLTQLLTNLVDNALKYTPDGGRATVSVERERGMAKLVVRDTGVGIAAEHLPHLFERFYRADDARSRTNGGAGLGLAICKWVVDMHRGQIEVGSTPGTGTTFTVRLPLIPDSRPASSASSNGGGGRQ
jgi:heavy metal sensor kinase